MAFIKNLLKNGNFQFGTLSPWKGLNSCLIEAPCPNVEGRYSAVLKSGDVDSSIEQLFIILPDEAYQLNVSLATNGTGDSPFVSIQLDYLNGDLNFIESGLELFVKEKQLPNGKKGTFKVIQNDTSLVPVEAVYGRLKVSKHRKKYAPGVIIDNVTLNRFVSELADSFPTSYVGNSGNNSVSVLPSGQKFTFSEGSPNALLQLDGTFVYAAVGQSLNIIDAKTETITETLNMAEQVTYQYNRNILANEDGSRVYICNGTSNDDPGYVFVVNTDNPFESGPVEVGIFPVALALASDDELSFNKLYCLNQTSRTVSVIDTANPHTVTATLDIQEDGIFLIVTPGNKALIVGYREKDEFDVYDIKTNTKIQTVKYPNSNFRGRSGGLSLDNNYIYIGVEADDQLTGPGSRFLRYNATTFDFEQELTLSTGVNTGSGKSSPNTFVQTPAFGSTPARIFVGDAGEEIQRVWLVNVNSDGSLSEITHDSLNGYDTAFVGLSLNNSYIAAPRKDENKVTYIDTSTFSIDKSYDASSPIVLVFVDPV